MGKAMSVLSRRAKRPFMEFNVEARAEKAIAQEKRPAAPRHTTTAKIIEDSVRGQPEEVKKSLIEEDSHLLERLKQVYVTSHDPMPKKEIPENPDRPLPVSRISRIDPEYGYFEPKRVPYGKATLKTAIDLISKHQEDPELWTAERLAMEHKLDVGITEKILHYFRTFVLYVPKDLDKNQQRMIENLSNSPLTAPHRLEQLPGPNDDDLKSAQGGKS